MLQNERKCTYFDGSEFFRAERVSRFEKLDWLTVYNLTDDDDDYDDDDDDNDDECAV